MSIQLDVSKKTDPKVAEKLMLASGLKPLEPYKTALSKWKCQCLKCGSIVTPKYNTIQQGSGGCKNCGFEKLGKTTRLSEEKAIQIMLTANLKPLEPYVNNSSKWKSKCLICGKQVEPTLGNVQNTKMACIYCAKQKVDEKDAVKVMKQAGLIPLEPYTKSNAPWKCICKKCKQESSPTYGNVYMGAKCYHCMNVDVHKKQLKPSEEAIAVMQKANLKPLESYKGANRKWKSKCLKCGTIVEPKLASIISGQGGCINCMPFGINQKTPSYIYLITNKAFNAHKVGIGNHKKLNDRLRRFVKEGWETHRVWQAKTGAEALEIERAVFVILRKDMKLPIYLSNEDMPKTGGHSETVDAESITLVQLEKIIDGIIKDLGR